MQARMLHRVGPVVNILASSQAPDQRLQIRVTCLAFESIGNYLAKLGKSDKFN